MALKMSLFNRLSRVVRAEITHAKSQPEPELLHRMKMEARLQELNALVGGNHLSELIGLLEEIDGDIVAMKARLLGSFISR